MSALYDNTDDLDDDGEYDLDDATCTFCGGEGWEECRDPFQCTRAHQGIEHRCPACGGSGLRKDQVIW